jgi:dTMP kinase
VTASAPFIVIEGPEGSGKSTQVTLLRRRLEQGGRTVVTVREPGGTAIGDEIREMLLARRNHALTPGTELLLYMASRTQLVHEVIRPALERGELVLADRFLTSTVVYQGIAGALGADEVRRLYRLVCGDLHPDLTLILDLPAEEGLSRIRGKRDVHIVGLFDDRIESRPIEFHNRVREGYLAVAGADPARYAVIDASRGEEDVSEAVWREVTRRVLS